MPSTFEFCVSWVRVSLCVHDGCAAKALVSKFTETDQQKAEKERKKGPVNEMIYVYGALLTCTLCNTY